MSVKNPNKTLLTLEEKLKIITTTDSKVSKRSIAREYGLAPSTVSRLFKQRHIIETTLTQYHNVNRKRVIRASKPLDQVNTSILDFYRRCSKKHIAVTGPLLQTKAKEIGDALGLKFSASNGWLHSFTERHGIRLKHSSKKTRTSVEADVDSDNLNVGPNWIKTLSDTLANYSRNDIFSSIKMGLFYRQLPMEPLLQKDGLAQTGYLADERFSVLLCYSANGEKLAPLVVTSDGQKSSEETGLQTQHSQVTWKTNTYSWLLGNQIVEWLHGLDSYMGTQQRKIALFVEEGDCPAEIEFTNMKLVFLPPRAVCSIRPCDEEIIRTVKSLYRKFVVEHYIGSSMNAHAPLPFVVRVTEGIKWLNDAWALVSDTTIRKSFRGCGIETAVGRHDKQAVDIFGSIPLFTQHQFVDPEIFATFDDDLEHMRKDGETMEEIFQVIIESIKEAKKEADLAKEAEQAARLVETSVNDTVEQPEETGQVEIQSFEEALTCLRAVERFAFARNSSALSSIWKTEAIFTKESKAERATCEASSDNE